MARAAALGGNVDLGPARRVVGVAGTTVVLVDAVRAALSLSVVTASPKMGVHHPGSPSGRSVAAGVAGTPGRRGVVVTATRARTNAGVVVTATAIPVVGGGDPNPTTPSRLGAAAVRAVAQYMDGPTTRWVGIMSKAESAPLRPHPITAR